MLSKKNIWFQESEITEPYWLIKKMSGSRWFEQGYYRVYRGDRCILWS